MYRPLLAFTLTLIVMSLLAIGAVFITMTLLPSSVVAYVALRDGDPAVMIHDLNHGLKHRILYNDFVDPTWSPDGRFIAFAELFRYGSDIIVSDVTGTTVRNLTQSVARDETPVWSPDGEWIAFSSNREGDNNLYLVRPDGSDLHLLTDHPSSDRNPSWSPDSQSIAFASNREDGWDIYTLHIPSGTVTQLTTHNAPDTQPAWSPDGTKIVFVSRRSGQTSSLYLYSVATNTVSPLVVTDYYDDSPSWTPDGQGVTFSRSINTLPRLMQYDMTTGTITAIDVGEQYADTLVWLR